jgi:hypothetical protein
MFNVTIKAEVCFIGKRLPLALRTPSQKSKFPLFYHLSIPGSGAFCTVNTGHRDGFSTQCCLRTQSVVQHVVHFFRTSCHSFPCCTNNFCPTNISAKFTFLRKFNKHTCTSCFSRQCNKPVASLDGITRIEKCKRYCFSRVTQEQ